jgi:hypothetical protein
MPTIQENELLGMQLYMQAAAMQNVAKRVLIPIAELW